MKDFIDREIERTKTTARIAHRDGGMTLKASLGLITSLTLWDVVAMNIVAVVGLRWISRSARLGAPSVTLWILACLVFFVPLAAVIAELSSRHPEQGGIYAWARRAFGPAHGFVCGWCMWVNNLFYFPALLLFAGANLLVPLGAGRRGDRRQPLVLGHVRARVPVADDASSTSSASPPASGFSTSAASRRGFRRRC